MCVFYDLSDILFVTSKPVYPPALTLVVLLR